VTGKPLPQASTDPERKVVTDVQRHGWHVIKVGPGGDTPGWAYTIGLFHTFGHPEIILFGLPLDTAHVLLNTAGAAIRAGKGFQPDVPYDDFLQGYDCVLKATHAQWHKAFVGFAIWFYRPTDFPVLQLFWPDRDRVMPWEPAASPWQRAHQPLLFESSVESARVGDLLDTLGGERDREDNSR
jgi:hypothetical protein